MSADSSVKHQYLTLAELCARARVSPATAHRWKNRGLIPFVQPAGKRGRLLFPANALEACQNLQTSPAAAPSAAADSSPTKLRGRRPKWTAGPAEASPIQP